MPTMTFPNGVSAGDATQTEAVLPNRALCHPWRDGIAPRTQGRRMKAFGPLHKDLKGIRRGSRAWFSRQKSCHRQRVARMCGMA